MSRKNWFNDDDDKPFAWRVVDWVAKYVLPWFLLLFFLMAITSMVWMLIKIYHG